MRGRAEATGEKIPTRTSPQATLQQGILRAKFALGGEDSLPSRCVLIVPHLVRESREGDLQAALGGEDLVPQACAVGVVGVLGQTLGEAGGEELAESHAQGASEGGGRLEQGCAVDLQGSGGRGDIASRRESGRKINLRVCVCVRRKKIRKRRGKE